MVPNLVTISRQISTQVLFGSSLIYGTKSAIHVVTVIQGTRVKYFNSSFNTTNVQE